MSDCKHAIKGSQMHYTFENSEAKQNDARRKAAFQKIDITAAWAACGLNGPPEDSFQTDLFAALEFYQTGPDRMAFIPAKLRNTLYSKLEKSIANLEQQLDELDDRVAFEIDAASVYFGPDDEDELLALLSGENEGLGYGSYHIYSILDHLAELKEIVAAARESRARGRGKPKQNQTLADTITKLGHVFTKYTDQEPMMGYRFDDWNNGEEAQVYHGPFFDLLHLVFWSMNGPSNPTSHVIGDTARRAFNLKK
jgi:hypothetical protein